MNLSVKHWNDNRTKEAEKKIEKQAEIFERERDYLISIYSTYPSRDTAEDITKR